SGILCDKLVPHRLKAKIYKTMVRPVALYGAECRSTSKRDEYFMQVVEMKMLRWALGHTRLDRIPNTEIRSKMAVRPIGDKLLEARLRWFGHVDRREPNSVAKSAMLMVVAGRRSRGRPKIRWMDNVTADLQAVGLREADTQNRAKWRCLARRPDPITLWD